MSYVRGGDPSKHNIWRKCSQAMSKKISTLKKNILKCELFPVINHSFKNNFE